jgi:response regulator RpfG family c-di-GMP phosphodiesterase
MSNNQAIILIVDDIKENLMILLECLQSQYHIIAAKNGKRPWN